LDARNHAKLCALAALRGVDRSATAAEILKAGLKDVVVIDPESRNDPARNRESATGANGDKKNGEDEEDRGGP
jgi:hypothetical protein